MTDKLVTVYRAGKETTANIVKAALEDAGIPAIVQSNETSWLDGVFVSGEGYWGSVLVNEADADRAIEILEEYAKGTNETDLEELS